MIMSLVPVILMTSFTWIRYGINVKIEIYSYKGFISSYFFGKINS